MLSNIKKLLLKFSKEPLFENFYFVGGTALAFYLNHRISYDIDFISDNKLDVNRLFAFNITYNGKFIPDKNESVFKINTGNDLKEYKMTFNINGIKLEFFYPNDSVRLAILEKYKKNYQIINGIKVLPIIAIAELKLLALFRRKKIRDLFDVYVLLNERIIDIDLIDKFCAMEYDRTFIEYIESFKDDKTESLDFEKNNKYYEILYNLSFEEKEDYLKRNIIDLYITRLKYE